MRNPYRGREPRAFWSGAVAQRHLADMADLWDAIALSPEDRIATAGSCFAQHIGNALAARGAHFLDCEPPPPVFADAAEARRFGYGVFSCRYGNVYTARQMLQLAQEALGRRRPVDSVWEREGRFYDALRPAVDPAGHASAETVLLATVAPVFLALGAPITPALRTLPQRPRKALLWQELSERRARSALSCPRSGRPAG